MRSYFFIFFVAITITGCNRDIPKEKLTIIENITLGKPSNIYNKYFDSLQIPRKRFLNRILFMKFDELLDDNYYYSTYYTNLFNFSEYKNKKKSLEHLGLITPITLEGTQNNFALVVLLCHTTDPWLWGDAEHMKSDVKEKYIRQDVNEEVINKIKQMYISKYGEPKSIDTSIYNSFWMVNGNSIKRETDNTSQATTMKWETDYYTVSFFSGFNLNAIYNPENGYSESTNPITANAGDESADPLKNEMNCRSFAYIYYQLNEKAMKELKTDNKKL